VYQAGTARFIPPSEVLIFLSALGMAVAGSIKKHIKCNKSVKS
jgi:hypothetical protein